jgi:Cu(I)/Ag(I) efflux system membrane fusion protein
MKKYLAVGVLFMALSCTNTDKKNTEASTDTISEKKIVTSAVVELGDSKVQNIYNGYIYLKDALVESKFEDAQKAATQLKTSLASFPGCENTATIAEKIAAAKDIAGQRKEFTYLSSDVIAMFKHADLKKGSIYVQHCPMANKGEGADWLASEKQIQNPYYGDEMMDCGAVLEEIKSSK